jgi:polyhydroxyalkanoate synthesis repressor PhaR
MVLHERSRVRTHEYCHTPRSDTSGFLLQGAMRVISQSDVQQVNSVTRRAFYSSRHQLSRFSLQRGRPGVLTLTRKPATSVDSRHGDIMKDLREIRKYPNRRLYDTAESRYITITDVRKLVVGGIEFAVIDKQSRRDITDRVLLQVVSEQQHSGEPLFGREFLLQMIRLYGARLQGLVGERPRQNVSSLVLQSRNAPLPGTLSSRSPQAERGEPVAVAD